MITYEHQNGRCDSKGNRHWNIDVRLEGKIVGEIVSTTNGFVYKPKGTRKITGHAYATLSDCKASLEA